MAGPAGTMGKVASAATAAVKGGAIKGGFSPSVSLSANKAMSSPFFTLKKPIAC